MTLTPNLNRKIFECQWCEMLHNEYLVYFAYVFVDACMDGMFLTLHDNKFLVEKNSFSRLLAKENVRVDNQTALFVDCIFVNKCVKLCNGVATFARK